MTRERARGGGGSASGAVKAIAVDLDGALGDTRPLWRDWLEDAARRLRLGGLSLSDDRAAAAAELDERVGNWRALLERFAEDRAPVYLRPDSAASATLRRLASAGTPVGVFTDAPEELARVALAQLGAARRVAVVESGADAFGRVLARLGADALVVRTREELLRLG
jgi:phosphoglycolate phosphatase-like HAD superfamily hydrolase